jgi:hypothetical protein
MRLEILGLIALLAATAAADTMWYIQCALADRAGVGEESGIPPLAPTQSTAPRLPGPHCARHVVIVRGLGQPKSPLYDGQPE